MIDKRLLTLSEGSKKWIVLNVLMNWISLILNIITIISIGYYVEFTYKSGLDKSRTISTMLIILSAIIVRFVCDYMSVRFSYKSSVEARLNLRNTIYKKLLALGINYNKQVSTSEVVQVTVDGVEQLEIYFGKYLPQFFYSLLAPITLFIVLSFINFKTALVLLLCVPLIPVSIIAIMKLAKKLLSKYWGIYVNLGDTFLENLQGLTTLKIYNRYEDRNIKMNEEAENFRKITMKVLSMQLNSINIMDLIAFGGSALGIIITLREAALGRVSIGGAFSIILLSAEFFIPLRLLGSFFHIAMNGIAASEKIFRLLDMEEEKNNMEEVKNLENINIEIKDLDFSYEKERNILKNINLNIENKKITALVGVSGCGKSTISNIILGFYKDYDGNVLLNGHELRDIPRKQLMRNISLITHNSYIFAGTFEENLRMGKADATEKEMYEALKRVNLYDFVLSQDKELKAEIKERGSNLSGGQKQRLALARALLYNSEIYVFDEATSNIDVESEDQIMNVISELSKDKTIILISHRLYNVKIADKIYVLSKGEIKEEGNHHSLMERESLYFNLVREQEVLENIGGVEHA
ncbi:ABC transporter ATP-binding protein/permease [Hathewaya histolytica]|uniref:Multidrug resistance protein 1 n=1 Tax=Hathewaya histolytica TaxID=1498 RepID=A0A4U9R1K5_HATHI|nr:ABC transporter ATP-binding protein/permease [Hathewaya histolytica]VTQ84388.1 multidrug resistance protein 1 [Hathewaya histolytica]